MLYVWDSRERRPANSTSKKGEGEKKLLIASPSIQTSLKENVQTYGPIKHSRCNLQVWRKVTNFIELPPVAQWLVASDFLWPPWTVACQAPLSMGILQARILEWVAMPSSRGSSQPRDQTQVSHIAGRFFTSWATKEAQKYWSIKRWVEGLQAEASGGHGTAITNIVHTDMKTQKGAHGIFLVVQCG